MGPRVNGCGYKGVAVGDSRFLAVSGMWWLQRYRVCVLDEGMLEVYERVEAADGVVMAVPVHFGWIGFGVLGRDVSAWSSTDPRHAERLGFFICVGGMKPRRLCENALGVAKVWFTVINLRPAGELLVREVDSPEDMDRRADLIADAYLAGQQFAAKIAVAGSTEGGKSA